MIMWKAWIRRRGWSREKVFVRKLVDMSRRLFYIQSVQNIR